MYKYGSKDKTQSEKSRISIPATNKGHAQTGVRIKSLFNPAASSSALQMQLMPKQEHKKPQPLPIKRNEEQERLAPRTSTNHTGIPLQMKEKFESISGFSFEDVRVHYNSDKPVQMQALAYTQGNQVYIGPGHERHLGHELGHVVQQKLGRVNHTETINGQRVNQDPSLERDADWLAFINTPHVSRKAITALDNNDQVIQMYNGTEAYRAEAGETRYIHYRSADPLPAIPAVVPPVVAPNPISIMYETIVGQGGAQAVIDRFNGQFHRVPPRRDVALSLVVNTRPGAGFNQFQPLTQLNPLIHVEKLVFGKHTATENNNVEHPHETVPYYTLRRRAAINPVARNFATLLNSGGQRLWRKMGDNDMPFHDPLQGATDMDWAAYRQANQIQVPVAAGLGAQPPAAHIVPLPVGVDPQISHLMEISHGRADGALPQHGVRMVTFGYKLKTPDVTYFGDATRRGILNAAGAQAPAWLAEANAAAQQIRRQRVRNTIDSYIDWIYQQEVQFRFHLASPDSPLRRDWGDRPFRHYPAEPTSYYRYTPDTEGDVWPSHSGLTQMAEGRTLLHRLIPVADQRPERHRFMHEPVSLEETGSGNRHENLVRLLSNSAQLNIGPPMTISFHVAEDALFNEIMALNQSYFNPGTHALIEVHRTRFIKMTHRFFRRKDFHGTLQRLVINLP